MDPNPACNELERCTASGWSYPTPGARCPSGMCPATYVDVHVGIVCSPEGLDCSYAEGQCNCARTFPARMLPTWQCAMPAKGCPEPRPLLGSSCSDANLRCDYGACAGGIAMACRQGYWQQAFVVCPL